MEPMKEKKRKRWERCSTRILAWKIISRTEPCSHRGRLGRPGAWRGWQLSWSQEIRTLKLDVPGMLGVKEDQEHLTQCEAYKDLRGDHDLENQEELAEFFMKVMNRRKEKAMMRDRSTATQQEPSCSSQIVLVMIIWVQYIGYLTKGPTGQNRLSNFWLVFWNIFLKLLNYVLLERTPETKLSS